MILKFLEEEGNEGQYKRLSASRQLYYHILVNNIENDKSGEFIVATDINEETQVGQVIKMHYDEDNSLVTDSIEKF